ncbi:MAG: hypothetical protein E6J40_14270 [Chloroflexi bacterium]|nr:MAG: hypothetical protein E6J40_14270 [Chloroflexota bacterium]
MLESYEAYADYDDVMNLVEDMMVTATAAAGRSSTVTYQGEEISLAPPFRRERMADLVLEHTGKQAAGTELNDLFEEHVEAKLREPTFVTDYPIEISPLARKRDDLLARVLEHQVGHALPPERRRQRDLLALVSDRRRAARRRGGGDHHVLDQIHHVVVVRIGLVRLEHRELWVVTRRQSFVAKNTPDLEHALEATDQPSIRDVILFPVMKAES